MEIHVLHKSKFICIVDVKKLNYLRLEIVDNRFNVLKTTAGLATHKHSR